MSSDSLVARGRIAAVSHSPVASHAALKLMREGGNAVDAAVLASLVMGVAEPGWNGVGGGGFALIYDGGDVHVLDYREVAPSRARPSLYHGEREISEGYKAAAVPGTLRGLWELHQRFGQTRWKRILEEAAGYAESWRATWLWSRCLKEGIHNVWRKLRTSRESVETWLRDGKAPEKGEAVPQLRLARLLRGMKEGVEEFYSGWVAEKISMEILGGGGLLEAEDLEKYRPVWRKPVRAKLPLRDLEVEGVSMPPPGSGAIVLEALKVLGMVYEELGQPGLDRYMPLLAHVLQHALAERERRIGDPAYCSLNVEEILGERHVFEVAERIVESIRETGLSGTEESGTSHITVVDSEGMWVSLTESLECFMGSGVTVEGVILNDEMHDFELDEGHHNSIEGGKRPASSMSPTIFLDRSGEPVLATGASGGLRIISSIVQVLGDIFLRGVEPVEAVSRARIHPRGGFLLHEEALPAEVSEVLKRGRFRLRRGGVLSLHPGTDIYFGAVQSVLREDGMLLALSDPRKQPGALAAK